MRITELEAALYCCPFEKPIKNSIYTYDKYEVITVHLKTDEGITGFGWVKGGADVLATVLSLKDVVIGRDPYEYEKIWSLLYRPKITGRKGLGIRAVSCIDIAIWDLMGKTAGQPVYKLLGGFNNKLPAYIAGGYYEESKGIEGLIEEMQSNLEMGAKAVKMKIGKLSVREDLLRIEAVRKAIGPDVKLMIDANNAYTPSDAIEMARGSETYDVYWFEEPVHPDDLPGLKRVAQKSNIRIATGENEYTAYGFRDLIVNDTVDVINPDAHYCGGVTEWKKIADLARTFNVQVAPHGSQQLHCHLLASISNGLILEYYPPNTNPILGGQMFNETLSYDQGFVSPPERPGLGFELNHDFMKKYLISHVS